MNCDEVMELMQRHLDRDLNDAEHEAMLTHLQRCPDCMEMFAKLQQLSQELASLPKVAPPFSLVDSILPQLAEIDRANGRGDVSPVPATAGAADSAVVPLTTERPGRFRAAWSLAATGGIVAAGLLLALFINDMDGTKVADDTRMLMDSGSRNKSSATYESASSSRASSGQTAADAKPEAPAASAGGGEPKERGPAVAQSGVESGKTVKSGQAESAPAPNSLRNQQGTAGGAPAGGTAPNGAGAASDKAPSTGGDTPARTDAGGSVPTEGKQESISGGGGMADANKSAFESGSPGSAGSAGSAEDKTKMGISAAEGAESASPSASGSGGPGQRFGIAGPADEAKGTGGAPEMSGLMTLPPPILVSEDGVLVATVDSENRKIVVTTNDDKKTQMFVSGSWGAEDSAKLLRWRGSKQLTYSVTTKDGKTKTIAIDIAKSTETVQQP
ncbi:anti-sigma factor family protein [Paenibacillus sp. GYB003]|uniref:anti-sigma factor family protein n=1 Tax=Paenibacillus sp. GYB003 TaxID=2994392 RepID=UPI002F96A2A2